MGDSPRKRLRRVMESADGLDVAAAIATSAGESHRERVASFFAPYMKLMDPDVEGDLTDVEIPGLTGIYHGRDELNGFLVVVDRGVGRIQVVLERLGGDRRQRRDRRRRRSRRRAGRSAPRSAARGSRISTGSAATRSCSFAPSGTATTRSAPAGRAAGRVRAPQSASSRRGSRRSGRARARGGRARRECCASRAGDVGGEPLAMSGRDEAVLAALPDRHRDFDRGEVESRVADECEVVVEPSPEPVAEREAERAGGKLGVLATEDGGIRGRDEVAERVEQVGALRLTELGRPLTRGTSRAPRGPALAAPNSSWFSSPIPSSQSSPSASTGATPATEAHASTRSGRSAAQASV